ncbi:TetR/AcrR family transcriptional regulator [Novosphingobium album (ex Hu et al. 2023)]|uniref:TetR/AcrR family transcriptional regulator n=1 Tax=Novosphingobium album (ex Hu et al. 2023) TaxID=2930093 RepID=A0ABT0B5F1_9SPHN|nr:TetR/AcrR family transcriptional regulator [Novosphingobium album (ex Hu et al. 2023)]MCJ2180233.1 TetR/AcrR family transcriptional regulator [Novosphingobium album (ex Hu et al. 2023)]
MTSDVKKPRRKRHAERPDIKEALLDATETLIREEGYAAATARRIASKVGLKHQVIFYYFGSQDELLAALFRRFADAQNERLKAALNSETPLSSLWHLHRDPESTRFTLEFMALANHNEVIRSEIAKNAETVRSMETEAVERHLRQRGIEPRMSPQMVTILTNALARLLVQEASLGIHLGHEEARRLSDASFAAFEAMGATIGGVEPIIDAMETGEPLGRDAG